MVAGTHHIMMKKSIYIAHTGGTIGMQAGPHGYQPRKGHLALQMSHISALKSAEMPRYDIHEYDPLIDSANMTPHNWLEIAQDIAAHYDRYDGFVVLHGTDTMAYTASALPFMLQGLRKPVIITGGQIPLCEVRNDSRENLITAMLIAARYPIPEVCLYFGGRLLRGNRAVKVDAEGFAAFDSPNLPPLGTAGSDIHINWDLVRPMPAVDQPLRVSTLAEPRVAALRLFPGISATVLENILIPPIRGLVLETYGVGNGPSDHQRLVEVLGKAVARGVVIVNCTQCLKGTVKMDAYATGSALGRSGVISGMDMTREAALAKLFHLLSQDMSVDAIKTRLQSDLCGELTRPADFQQ